MPHFLARGRGPRFRIRAAKPRFWEFASALDTGSISAHPGERGRASWWQRQSSTLNRGERCRHARAPADDPGSRVVGRAPRRTCQPGV